MGARLANVTALVCCGVLLIACCAVFFININHGFDITDESFYLLSAQFPADVQASFFRYGFYTGLLYQLGGESVVALRSIGIVLLLLASFILSLTLFRQSQQNEPSPLVLQLATVGASLVYYNYWLLTPSYNWLALVGLLLAGSGMFSALSCARENPLPGIAVGVSGALCFVAKPSVAAALALIYLLWVALHHRDIAWLRTTVISALSASAALLLHSYLLEGGVQAYADRVTAGVRLGEQLGAGHVLSVVLTKSWLDISSLPRLIQAKVPWSLGLAAIGGCLVYIVERVAGLSSKWRLGYAVAVPIACWLELWQGNSWVGGSGYGNKLGLSALSFLLPCLIAGLVCRFMQPSGGDHSPLSKRLSLLTIPLICVLFAGAFAFGSNNGLLRQSSLAFVFYAAAILHCGRSLSLSSNSNAPQNIVSALVLLSSLLVSYSALDKPYRSALPITAQTSAFDLRGRDTLITDPDTAAYANELMRIADRHHWHSGNYLIDLTGGSPGALVILGARFITIPWLAGGYKGSNDFVTAALGEAEPANLSNAWVLVAPSGRRSVDNQVLQKLGLDFPASYIEVGELVSGHRSEAQVLYRPK